MKQKSKQILKGVLLSAIASMFGNNANAEEKNTTSMRGILDNDVNKIESSSHRVYKNVLKMNPSGNIVPVDSHRSHSSHSSHRSGSYVRNHSSHTSHTSHSSSSTGYGTTTRSRSTTTRSTGTSSSSTSRSTNSTRGTSAQNTGTVSSLYTTPKPVDPKTIELGERVISLNSYGNDVNKLVRLLAEKHYIRESWASKKDGYMLYDVKIQDAVKHFQRDAELVPIGNLDLVTLNKLSSWDVEKTTFVLGVRDLYYIENAMMYGTDVDELVTILVSKGIIADMNTIEKKNGFSVFNLEIESAVKKYQLRKNMIDTGRVDEFFVKSIKEKEK